MIRNIIIICLLLVIVFDISGKEFLEYLELALDKSKEIVYTIKSEVK
jgi:hypothetical protein